VLVWGRNPSPQPVTSLAELLFLLILYGNYNDGVLDMYLFLIPEARRFWFISVSVSLTPQILVKFEL
jgi:hypothetical protein